MKCQRIWWHIAKAAQANAQTKNSKEFDFSAQKNISLKFPNEGITKSLSKILAILHELVQIPLVIQVVFSLRSDFIFRNKY